MSRIKFVTVVTAILLSPPMIAGNERLIPSPSALPALRPTIVMEPKDGEIIELKAGFVKEKVGSKWRTRLAYNQQIPGPTIKVQRGSSIKIRLVNMTGEPTALHSHGLRVDDKNDGVVGIGQDPIPDKGEMIYHLKFPDSGLYWYHPHLADEYGQEMGLQGNFLVEDPGMNSPSVDRHQILMVDDILADAKGLPHFKNKTVSFALMGRYGNQQLINNSANWRSSVSAGEVVRFWLTNSANARPFKIAFDGLKMKWIGSDNGLLESDIITDSLTLAPSERAIVDVYFPKAGRVRVLNVGPEKPVVLGEIDVRKNKKLTVSDQSEKQKKFMTLALRPALSEEFRPLKAMFDAKPDILTRIDVTVKGAHADHVMEGGAGHDGIEWDDTMPGMSAEMTSNDVTWRIIDESDGKENMDIQWKFKRNVPVKIRISNNGKNHPMQHPIHFHGQRFLVISRDGKRQENLGWKDSALIAGGEVMDIVLDNHNPGRWMGHCHISEHLGSGMMFGFEVQ